jgi:predicted unusual protein kinase regulating ubiquinone biosynthesis (AarF/ABC1/UbiB family)
MIEPDPVRDGNYLCYFTKVSPVKPQKEFLIPWSEPLRCFIISPGKNANGIISPMYRNRYRRILWFFAKVILSFIWWDIILFKIGLKSLARNTRTNRFRKMAKAFRFEAIQMGGVMIKIGQFLSARLDVLPREITDELAGLQDEVRPETFEDIKRVIETDLNGLLETKFYNFEETALAAASIGQVHRAQILVNGETESEKPVYYDVAVKVQRPEIDKIIEVDLSALRIVAGWLMRYQPIRKRADIPALLAEFSRSLYEEIDYLHEGKNAETFSQNFKNRPEIRVPEVIWGYTTRRVLTLEYIPAIKISDYPAIEAAGIDRAAVANLLFDSYLKQILEDRFFHADPHPGNLFVQQIERMGDDSSTKWRLVFVDFGMTGEITPTVLSGLREGLIALALRDAARLIKAYQIMGVLLPGADLALLEKASARVFERLWGKTAPELMKMHMTEAQEFIKDFEALVYEMPFQAPENIVLLVRCIGILSGICTGLSPDFNVWTSIVPYAEKTVAAEDGGRWKFLVGQVGDFLRVLAVLPQKTESLLNRIEQGNLEVRVPELRSQFARLERSNQQITAAILFAAFAMTAVQAYLGREVWLAGGLGSGALFSLIWLLFRR